MRNDITAGICVSAVIHAAAFFGGYVWPTSPTRKSPPPPKEVVQLIDLPRVEPDDPEPAPPTDEPANPMDFAPPSQIDRPQLVTDTSAFTQRLQPPPPDSVKAISGIVTVPENRDPRQWNTGTIFDPASLDQQPVARVKPAPQYPFEMKRNGTSGEVVVDFIVDTSGNVQNAYALRSTQREFEQPAVQAVGKWKFKPGRKGGRAVNTHMQVPIVFTLSPD